MILILLLILNNSSVGHTRVNEELPDAFSISEDVTLLALQRVKTNKTTGPDNIPAWVLKDHANILAAPLTAIFNSSLREGVLPNE